MAVLMSRVTGCNAGGVWEQSWQSNLLELESKLARSKAQWKIVIGHHPVYSNGHHNSTAELIQHVQPLLQVRHMLTLSFAAGAGSRGLDLTRLQQLVSMLVCSGHVYTFATKCWAD